MEPYRGIPLRPDKQGKVRDLFDLGESLILVATDRISAFDGVLKTPIPGKGRILTQISNFFFEKTRHLIPNHLIETDYRRFPEPFCRYPDLEGRAVLVKKGKIIPFECIVRGYLLGSGLKSYQATGAISGVALPPGLKERDRLPEPIFTPTTKAEAGHDEPVTFEEVEAALGKRRAAELRERSIELYRFASKYCLERGIVLADTKLEFAEIDGELVLADELFTPDSSRYFDREELLRAPDPKSFDKQYVRDYLISQGAEKRPEGAELPGEVVRRTVERYVEVGRRITGESLLGP